MLEAHSTAVRKAAAQFRGWRLVASFRSPEARMILAHLTPIRWRLAALAVLSFMASLTDGLRTVLLLAVVNALARGGLASREVTVPGLGWSLPISPAFLWPATLFSLLLHECLEWWQRHASSVAQSDFVERLREDSMRMLLHKPLRYFSQTQAGSSAYLINAQVSRFSTFIPNLADLLRSGLTLKIMLGMLLWMHPWWTAAVIAGGGLIWASLRPMYLRLYRLGIVVSDKSTAAAAVVQDAIRGIKLVKVCHAEHREAQKSSRAARQVADHQIRANDCRNSARAIGRLGLFGVLLLLALAAAEAGVESAASLGYLLIVMRTLPLVTQLSELRMSLATLWGHAVQVAGLHTGHDSTSQTATHWHRSEIHVAGLGVCHSPSHPVLADVSFRIHMGEPTVLVGLTGAGKSTLLDVLAGLRSIQRGNVAVPHGGVGYVTQEPVLFYGQVRHNTSYPDDGESFSWPFGRPCDFGLDWMQEVGESGSALSGGQRQLVALARLGWKHYRVWLLDEPTSSLDAQTEKIVMDWILSQTSGRIIVLSTHKLSAAKRFPRILVLHRGRIVQDGHHDALINQDGLYQRLWRLQEVE